MMADGYFFQNATWLKKSLQKEKECYPMGLNNLITLEIADFVKAISGFRVSCRGKIEINRTTLLMDL